MTDYDANSHGRDSGGTGAEGSDLRWLSLTLRFLLVLAILGLGVGISAYLLMNRPTPKRKPPSSEATLVEVTGVTAGEQSVIVKAMGTVVPTREIQLAAQVGGEIVRINDAIEISLEFVPGGHVTCGETLLQIDPKDYQLIVRQRSSDLVRAQCDLQVELGQQSVAKGEYELLGETVAKEDRELVLRQPQLDIAKAAVATAQASLEKAELDLARATVAAPFNAVVQTRYVNFGSQVAAGSPLATLVGTDTYWIEVAVPVSRLRWLDIPGAKGSVSIYHEAAWGEEVRRTGRVVRLMADLEPQGRMARLLVEVDDPLALTAKSKADALPPMILGAYVRVEIEGRRLTDVIRVPRIALRDGNRVWVMSPKKTLEIREVTIVWSNDEEITIDSGLASSDALIVSDLAAAVQDMLLRTEADEASPDSGDKKPKAKDRGAAKGGRQ
jgi:RND family efflux transporter MFP subunit